MNLIADNQQLITSRVDERLKQNGVNVRTCANGFNHYFKDAINNKKTRPINKESEKPNSNYLISMYLNYATI